MQSLDWLWSRGFTEWYFSLFVIFKYNIWLLSWWSYPTMWACVAFLCAATNGIFWGFLLVYFSHMRQLRKQDWTLNGSCLESYGALPTSLHVHTNSFAILLFCFGNHEVSFHYIMSFGLELCGYKHIFSSVQYTLD